MNVNEEQYIQRIKDGDVRAFSWLVSHYQGKVLTIIWKITGCREEAEDIAQEVFIKVFKAIGKFKGDAAFATWLYSIAYNTTMSELRKRKFAFIPLDDAPLVENAPDDDALESGDTEQRLACLDEALKQLSPDDAFLVSLYYMENQPIEAIAHISNLSVANVKVRLHRIRKRLAAEINRRMNNENDRQ
jgi:RNA polymerase sigma-70 factor (ECF subfamily)